MTTSLPDSCCPSCQAKIQAATDPLGIYRPQMGDLTVCLYCHAFLAFNEDFTLHVLTETEIQAIRAEDELAWGMMLDARERIKRGEISQRDFPNEPTP